MVLRKRSFGKYLGVLVFGALVTTTQAHAILVDGEEYTEVLQVETEAYLGFWRDEGKFYSINKGDWNTPSPISNTAVLDPRLEGFDYSTVYTMGMGNKTFFSSSLTSAVVDIDDSSGESIISAEYLSGGDFNYIWREGNAGEVSFSGLFQLTNGTIKDAGFYHEPLYISATFSQVTKLYSSGNDLVARYGTFTIYAKGEIPVEPPVEPPTEVPEPTTAALLSAGGIGALVRKRRK